MGPMYIIYAWSANGDDALSHYHGPARGFEQLILVPDPDFSWSGYVGGAFGLVMLFVLAFYLIDRRRRRLIRRMAEERFNEVRLRVNSTISAGAPQLSFGMAFVSARDFLELGKLVAHETLRDLNVLRLVDRYDQAKALVEVAGFKILFFSHQWLGFTAPDPDNTHYKCICLALSSLARDKKIDLDTALVWVDYCSIPQVNKSLQGLAISDLVEYASLATFFIVVVPHATHDDTKEECNKETYQARGWCRLEQFAKAATGETSNMFTCSSTPEDLRVKFVPYVAESTEWKRSALGVLHGSFSCCQQTKNHTQLHPIHGKLPCDRERLEPALLRIYMASILRLPDCPLRQELLNHEELILPSDRFNEDVIRAMHERFARDLAEGFPGGFPVDRDGRNHKLQYASLMEDLSGMSTRIVSARDDKAKLIAMVRQLQEELDQEKRRELTPREMNIAAAIALPLPPARTPGRPQPVLQSLQLALPPLADAMQPRRSLVSSSSALTRMETVQDSPRPALRAPARLPPVRRPCDIRRSRNSLLDRSAASVVQRRFREQRLYRQRKDEAYAEYAAQTAQLARQKSNQAQEARQTQSQPSLQARLSLQARPSLQSRPSLQARSFASAVAMSPAPFSPQPPAPAPPQSLNQTPGQTPRPDESRRPLAEIVAEALHRHSSRLEGPDARDLEA